MPGEVVTPLWQSLVTALSPAVVAALAALGGVALTNHTLRQHRAEDRRQRALDQAAERDAKAVQETRDMGLAALTLAQHLEDFVLQALDVVDSFWSVEWVEPYKTDQNHGDPVWLTVLPDWPALIDWRLIGLDVAVKATNFRRRVQLVRAALSAGADHNDGQQQHADEADAAAALALEAWDLAEGVRKANHLDPFEWPEGWSGVDRFKDHIERRKRI